MVAVLASPRFIYREEAHLPLDPGEHFPLVDEYSLASRLSFFLWSSPPDEELYVLAAAGQLRAELPAQIARMLRSPKSGQFVENFAGQWLHSRDIGLVAINDFDIYLSENPLPEIVAARRRLRELQAISEFDRTPEMRAESIVVNEIVTQAFASPRPKFSGELRIAMQQETELQFAHLLTENRSVLELLDCDYTFLNEALAAHYGIPGVVGTEMRKVTLPPGSPRGGILTQGTILAATSNPTRTSPVKRGVFILDMILGSPPSPPPPNIPALEDAAPAGDLTQVSLRDTLALHREKPLCRSCHDSMDPLGLALENFNAMGAWRDRDNGGPIAMAGQLITGERFTTIPEFKRLLATRHRTDFYYCVSEKLLIYALGRGLEYHDTTTLDQLVARLEASGGALTTLVEDVIASAPFQRMRPRTSGAVVAGPLLRETPRTTDR